MKNLFIIVTMFVALFASCTNETVESFNEEVENVNSWSFEEDSKSLKNEVDYEKFVKAADALVNANIIFDYFRESLPINLLKRIENKNFSVDDAVYAIFIWWSNPETFDVMVEMPDWDDFYVNMPYEYYQKYPFVW